MASALPTTLKRVGAAPSQRLRVRLQYVLTALALCVVAHVLLFDLARRVLFARHVNGKRCEHVSLIHVESAFHDPSNCFSRTDIQQILVGLTFAIHDVFARHNLTYWLDSGTLLGSYRDKTVIPHDTDVDIGVDAATFETLRTGKWDFPSVYELQVVGGTHHKLGSRDNGIPGRLIHTHSGFYVDIFVFHDDRATAASATPFFGPQPSVCFNGCCRCPRVNDGGAYAFSIPKDWVFPLQPCWFGGRTVNCPAKTERYLDYLYGPDFMTPDK